jgi:SHS2 domain-containing protein
MEEEKAGFREIEHTADWELHVWAPDFPSLLVQSARGMYDLSDTRLAVEPRLAREFEFRYRDRESLIVDFLSELLFLGEDEEIGFDSYQIEFAGEQCNFRVSGAPITDLNKEIKAVTYHGLIVRETVNGLSVNIVFDV